MATTVNITSNYAGQAALDLILPAFKGSDTIGNQLITVEERVAFKWNVRKLSGTLSSTDATCDYTPTGTFDFTERVLQPKELQLQGTLCKRDFVQMWDAEEVMRAGANAKKLAAVVQRSVVRLMAENVGDDLEDNVWHGVEASAGQFDGLITRMLADSDVIDVTGNGISTDPDVDASAGTYVIDALQAMIDALPKSIYRKSDVFIYIPRDVHAAYTRVLGGFGTAGLGANGVGAQGFNGEKVMNYNGFNLVYAPGLLDGYMVAAQKGNLTFGTSLIADFNEVNIVDTSETLADDNVRFSIRYTAGTQYAYGNEIVLGQYGV